MDTDNDGEQANQVDKFSKCTLVFSVLYMRMLPISSLVLGFFLRFRDIRSRSQKGITYGINIEDSSGRVMGCEFISDNLFAGLWDFFLVAIGGFGNVARG